MLYVEYTKKCNSKCITCDYWKNSSSYNEENIDFHILESIQKLYLCGLKVVLFTGGEALLKAVTLFEIAKKIKDSCPNLEIRLLTNGILVDKYIEDITKNFDTVVFSLDSIDERIYKKIRGVDCHNKVLDNITMLRNKSNHIFIRLRVMILPENTPEIFKITKFAIENNIDKVSFLLVDTSSNGFGRKNGTEKNNLNYSVDLDCLCREIRKIEMNYGDNTIAMEAINSLSELMKSIKDNKKISNTCNAPLTSIVIDANGNILPCFFKDNIGNVKEDDIIECIYSNNYSEIHKKRKTRAYDECYTCTL